MCRKTFIFMFVAWYCVNTVNGSPVSFENKTKCGNRCETNEIRIRINEDQWNEDQDGDLNVDEIFTGHVIPKRKKRQTTITDSSPDADEPSTELSPQVKDFTASAEYKKAQENLLSASEQIIKVKDSQVAPEYDVPSDDKSLLNAEDIQVTTEIETDENIQPQIDSTNLISSPMKPNPDETQILKETQETVPVDADEIPLKSDNSLRGGILTPTVDVATPDKTTEKKLTTYDTSVTSSIVTEDSKKPLEEKLNEVVSIKSDDNVEADTFILESNNSKPSGTSVDATGLRLNTVHMDNGDNVPGHTTENEINAVVVNPVKSDEISDLEENDENLLNSIVIEPVKKADDDTSPNLGDTLEAPGISTNPDTAGLEETDENLHSPVVKKPLKVDDADDDTSPNSADTSEAPAISTNPHTANTPDESHRNVPDQKNSVKQDTTRNLDVQPELDPLGIPKPDADSFDNNSVDMLVNVNNKIEIHDASKKHKDNSTIPDTPNTPLSSDNRKEGTHQNGKGGKTQNCNSNRHEHRVYNIDEWDEVLTETNSFGDIVEDTCDCGQNEYDNIVVNHDVSDDTIEYRSFDEPCEGNCDPTDYSSNYDNIEENHGHSADSDDYSQHTYDKPRDFFDDFEPENVFDDLFNSDIEFNRNHENKLQTSLYDHFDEDADNFDEDVDDFFR